MKIKKNGKLFTLTESDLKKISKKVINENNDLSRRGVSIDVMIYKLITGKQLGDWNLVDEVINDLRGPQGTEMIDLTIPRRNYMRKHDRGL
tara:strand:- start:8281 stop:8553 length:273 start_codon:yes stop_codon:yes gene_type:complete